MSSNESYEAGLKTDNTPAQKRSYNVRLHIRRLIFDCKPFF